MKYEVNTEGTQYDVVGIGNAIVDVLAHVEDAFLDTEKMTKGAMGLIDEARMLDLYQKIESVKECSGGSVANSMAALASLGARSAYMGRVHADEFGQLFADDMHASGVTFKTEPVAKGKPTACCIVCVTPDAERTMNTYLGACTEMEPSDVDETAVSKSAIVYVEGYLWDQPAAKAAIRKALSAAKMANRTVALSLSDTFCVDRHRAEFRQLLEKDVDVLFANEFEILSLFETDNMSEAIEQVLPLVDVGVITRSEQGAIVTLKEEDYYVPADIVKNVVDTTGAGDLFAAGFLYGLSQGWSVQDCAKQGHHCAGQIIQQIGARAEQPLQKLVA